MKGKITTSLMGIIGRRLLSDLSFVVTIGFRRTENPERWKEI
jgi:hypothetical protein